MKQTRKWLSLAMATVILFSASSCVNGGTASSDSSLTSAPTTNSSQAGSQSQNPETESKLPDNKDPQNSSKPTSKPTSAPTTNSSQAGSQSQNPAVGLELPEYKAPDDGIDYDTTPLTLNPKMGFITRNGDKLMDGNKEFRFISANAPTALDSLPFEQEDIVKTIAQMGGQVLRTYTFSVSSSGLSKGSAAYIVGKEQYNEEAFKRLDQLIAYCHKYGVRLIIPFIDKYNYNGGIPEYIKLFGVSYSNAQQQGTAFMSNKEIVASFKHFVSYVLNRTNTITGVKYKDDPAILAWESGNELGGNNVVYNRWMRELAAYIKSIDSKHLVVDGHFGVRAQALQDPNIDIVSDHFYPHIGDTSFVKSCKALRDSTRGKKVAIVGEFGFSTFDDMVGMYDEAIKNGISGTLMWSIRPHDDRGGFIQHRENEGFETYHWPGFKHGEYYSEKAFLNMTYLKGYEIQGKKPKLIEKPAVPTIIEPFPDARYRIKWQGSTGAYGYDFQRAESPNGPWITIGVDISDDYPYATTMFKDKFDPTPGKTYYYRVRAKSIGGFSDWSKPVACTIPNKK